MSDLRPRRDRDHARECLHLDLYLQEVWAIVETEAGGLLCLLLVRIGRLSTDASGEFGGRVKKGLTA